VSSKAEETDALLDKLLDRVDSDAAAFLLAGSRTAVLCSGTKSVLVGAPQDVSVEELAASARYAGGDGGDDNDDDDSSDAKKKKTLDRARPLDFKLYWTSVSAEDATAAVPNCAPLIYHQKRALLPSRSLQLNLGR